MTLSSCEVAKGTYKEYIRRKDEGRVLERQMRSPYTNTRNTMAASAADIILLEG